MKTYIVETGGNYKKTLKNYKDLTLEDAVAVCFWNYPPRNPGILTRIRVAGKVDRRNRKNVWHYISTQEALKMAGFEVLINK